MSGFIGSGRGGTTTPNPWEVGQDYWWTGTDFAANTDTPEAGWIPIFLDAESGYTPSFDTSVDPNTGETVGGVNNPYEMAYWMNPDIAPEQFGYDRDAELAKYGITFGDPYAPEVVPLGDSPVTGPGRDDGGIDGGTDGGIIIDPGDPIDTSQPQSVWDGYDAQLSQWQTIFAEALSTMDLDFGDQQTILDALTDRILNYENPDLSQAYTDMDRLIAEIEAAGANPDIARIQGLIEGGFEDEAWDFVAHGYGFETAQEYFDWQAEMRGLTRADMQGLTDEEIAEYDKIMRMDMADAERRSQTQMEAVMADTGSYIQYMAAADEANATMVNMQSQYRADQLNQNVELQTQELDRKMAQYESMVSSGQMSATQYMDTRQRGYETILNGYLTEMQVEVSALTAALEGVQGVAELKEQESINDLAALNTQMESVYTSMMIQSGINEAILTTLNNAYDTMLKPQLDAVNVLLARENLSAQDRAMALEERALLLEEETAMWEIGLSVAETVISAVDLIPGVGD